MKPSLSYNMLLEKPSMGPKARKITCPSGPLYGTAGQINKELLFIDPVPP